MRLKINLELCIKAPSLEGTLERSNLLVLLFICAQELLTKLFSIYKICAFSKFVFNRGNTGYSPGAK